VNGSEDGGFGYVENGGEVSLEKVDGKVREYD
jgi:hypothetical protein